MAKLFSNRLKISLHFRFHKTVALQCFHDLVITLMQQITRLEHVRGDLTIKSSVNGTIFVLTIASFPFMIAEIKVRQKTISCITMFQRAVSVKYNISRIFQCVLCIKQ